LYGDPAVPLAVGCCFPFQIQCLGEVRLPHFPFGFAIPLRTPLRLPFFSGDPFFFLVPSPSCPAPKPNPPVMRQVEANIFRAESTPDALIPQVAFPCPFMLPLKLWVRFFSRPLPSQFLSPAFSLFTPLALCLYSSPKPSNIRTSKNLPLSLAPVQRLRNPPFPSAGLSDPSGCCPFFPF